MRVQPVPVLKGEWPEEVGLAPLDATGRPHRRPRSQGGGRPDDRVLRGHGRGRCREPREADGERPQPRSTNLGAAEKLLAAALRFHEYARERLPRSQDPDPKRQGMGRAPHVAHGQAPDRAARLLRAALAAKDNARIRELSTRLMNTYPKDAGVAKEVAVARIGEVERLLDSGNHPDNVRAKELLDELEAKYPGAGGDSARKLRGQLRDLAQKAFERARQKKAVGDLNSAGRARARRSARRHDRRRPRDAA